MFSKPPQFQPRLKYENFNSDTTNSGVDGKSSLSTPQFMVSKLNFCHQHHNLWCPSRDISSGPNISTEAEIVGVWKTKKLSERLLLVLTVMFTDEDVKNVRHNDLTNNHHNHEH